MASTDTRKAPCRAKDPKTCPYHGAVIRMEAAAASNDLDAYFTARQQVEAAEATGFADQEIAQIQNTSTEKSLTVEEVESAIKKYEKEMSGDKPFARNLFVQELESLSYQKDPNATVNIEGLGKVRLVDAKFGEEDGGSNIWAVFEAKGKMYRIYGNYSSWDGEDWYDSVDEVEIEKKVETKVVNIFKQV